MKSDENKSNKSKYKYLLQNTALLSLASFGSKFLSFFLVPLYTNLLSTSEYGIADIITTSATLLVYILTVNIGASVLRFGIDQNERPGRVFIYGARIDFFGCIVLAVGLGICYILKLVHWEWYCYIFLWLVFMADAFETLANQYLRAIDKVKVMAISSVMGTLLRLCSNILFLLVFRWGMFGYLISLVIGPAISTLYAMIHIFPIKKEKIEKEYEIRLHREMISYAIPAMFGQLGWWINNSLDKYFVIWLKGTAVNGVYSISYKLPSIMSMLCNIFGQAWGISAIKDFDKNDEGDFFGKTYELYNCVLTCCCSGMTILNVYISKYMFAKDFFEAWKYAPILIIAMLFSGLSSFWGGIFNAVKKNEIIARTTIIGGVVNCVFNLILIPPMGALGAAIATLISFYSLWLLRYIASKTYIKCRIHLLKHHILYVLLIVQVVFDSFPNHLYIGQLIILLVVIGLNYKLLLNVLNVSLEKTTSIFKK